MVRSFGRGTREPPPSEDPPDHDDDDDDHALASAFGAATLGGARRGGAGGAAAAGASPFPARAEISWWPASNFAAFPAACNAPDSALWLMSEQRAEVSPAYFHAQRELCRCVQVVGDMCGPCAVRDEMLIAPTLVSLMTAQRELLATADPAWRRTALAWVSVTFPARAAALRSQLCRFLWPACAECGTAGLGCCAAHASNVHAVIPPLNPAMRLLSCDRLGEAVEWWYQRSHAPLDYAGCLEALSVLSHAAAWLYPLHTDAEAAGATALAWRAGPACELLGELLHGLHSAGCVHPFATCSAHRALWAMAPPPPLPLPPEEAADEGGASTPSHAASGGTR